MVKYSLDDLEHELFAYLNKNKKKKKMATIRCCFKNKPLNWKLSPNQTVELYLGHNLKESAQGFYISVDYTEVSQFTPPREAIEMYEVRDYHNVSGTNSNLRASGEYTYGSAKCICDEPHTTGGKTERFHQPLSVKSPSWEDLQELVKRIKEGSILPKVPYNKPQVKPLPIQFYDWLQEGIKIFKRDVLRFKTVF